MLNDAATGGGNMPCAAFAISCKVRAVLPHVAGWYKSMLNPDEKNAYSTSSTVFSVAWATLPQQMRPPPTYTLPYGNVASTEDAVFTVSVFSAVGATQCKYARTYRCSFVRNITSRGGTVIVNERDRVSPV